MLLMAKYTFRHLECYSGQIHYKWHFDNANSFSFLLQCPEIHPPPLLPRVLGYQEPILRVLGGDFSRKCGGRKSLIHLHP